MKKIYLIILILPFLLPIAAQAVDDYTLLAPLPCVGGDGDCDTLAQQTVLEKYLPGVFKLAIGLSAAAAVLMIVVGGFQYISSDAIMKKSEGKERIKNAVFGLVLVIAAWLILNEINPKLLSITLDIESVDVKNQGGELYDLSRLASYNTGKILPGYSLTEEQKKLNAAMVKDLQDNYKVSVNNKGKACENGETSGCTNLVGLPDSAYRGVATLAALCKDCGVQITGGTEGGHQSHGPNKPVMDLALNPNLENFIIKNKTAGPQQTILGPLYVSKVGDKMVSFLKEGDHWHVVFP